MASRQCDMQVQILGERSGQKHGSGGRQCLRWGAGKELGKEPGKRRKKEGVEVAAWEHYLLRSKERSPGSRQR